MENSSKDGGYCVYAVYGEGDLLSGYHINPFLCNVEGTFKDVLEYAANNVNGFYTLGGGGYIIPITSNIILDESKKLKLERKEKIVRLNSIVPRVGVATIIENNNKILLGLRKSELGKNTWGLPGGKLDFGEKPEDCAVRELFEETNLNVNVNVIELSGISNAVFDDETHYITIFYKTTNYSGNLKVVEPDKCEKWEWFDYDNLPENLFLPFKNYIEKKFS